MKLYAVRDRLINYFMKPFVADSDNQVLATIADSISQEGGTSGIQQAPHQYEVWKLANITEDGHINEDRQLLADCGSLIRATPGADRRPTAGNAEADGPGGRGLAALPGAPGKARAETRPVPGKAPKRRKSAQKTPGGRKGGNRRPTPGA